MSLLPFASRSRISRLESSVRTARFLFLAYIRHLHCTIDCYLPCVYVMRNSVSVHGSKCMLFLLLNYQYSLSWIYEFMHTKTMCWIIEVWIIKVGLYWSPPPVRLSIHMHVHACTQHREHNTSRTPSQAGEWWAGLGLPRVNRKCNKVIWPSMLYLWESFIASFSVCLSHKVPYQFMKQFVQLIRWRSQCWQKKCDAATSHS